MAKSIRFVMVGGFLGAGKTTTLARLARHYISQGLNIAIVTNDQAADLVDTKSLRSQGFDVGEVAGACFCCRFEDLMSTIEGLGSDQAPDLTNPTALSVSIPDCPLWRNPQAEPGPEDSKERARNRILAQGRLYPAEAVGRGGPDPD
jgi:hypothetical protein